MLYEWRIECYITSLTVVLRISCHDGHILMQLQGTCVYMDTHTRTYTHTYIHTHTHTHTCTHTMLYHCFILVCSKNAYKQYLDYLFLILSDQKLLQPISEDGLVAMVRLEIWIYIILICELLATTNPYHFN